MTKTIFEKTYDGFESLYDLERDIVEALDPRFNEAAKDLPPEFQGKIKVTLTYED